MLSEYTQFISLHLKPILGAFSKLSEANMSYNSVQKLLSSSLVSKNLNIEIDRNIILRVVLSGCETWSLALRLGT
jgi:hypothetical protein